MARSGTSFPRASGQNPSRKRVSKLDAKSAVLGAIVLPVLESLPDFRTLLVEFLNQILRSSS